MLINSQKIKVIFKECYYFKSCKKVLKDSFGIKFNKRKAREAPHGNKGKMSIGNVVFSGKGSCSIAYTHYKEQEHKAEYQQALSQIKKCKMVEYKIEIESIQSKVDEKESICDALKIEAAKNRAEQNKLLGNARSISNKIRNSKKRRSGPRTNTSSATTTVQKD